MSTEQGPTRIAHLVGMYSGDLIWVGCSSLGMSHLVDLLLSDKLRDEVRFLRCLLHASSMGGK